MRKKNGHWNLEETSRVILLNPEESETLEKVLQKPSDDAQSLKKRLSEDNPWPTLVWSKEEE